MALEFHLAFGHDRRASADLWRRADQNSPVDGGVDIATGQDHGNPLAAHASALLHEPGKRDGGACAFRDIVPVLEIGPHCFGDAVFAQL